MTTDSTYFVFVDLWESIEAYTTAIESTLQEPISDLRAFTPGIVSIVLEEAEHCDAVDKILAWLHFSEIITTPAVEKVFRELIHEFVKDLRLKLHLSGINEHAKNQFSLAKLQKTGLAVLESNEPERHHRRRPIRIAVKDKGSRA